jgi:hypothetical protein
MSLPEIRNLSVPVIRTTPPQKSVEPTWARESEAVAPSSSSSRAAENAFETRRGRGNSLNTPVNERRQQLESPPPAASSSAPTSPNGVPTLTASIVSSDEGTRNAETNRLSGVVMSDTEIQLVRDFQGIAKKKNKSMMPKLSNPFRPKSRNGSASVDEEDSWEYVRNESSDGVAMHIMGSTLPVATVVVPVSARTRDADEIVVDAAYVVVTPPPIHTESSADRSGPGSVAGLASSLGNSRRLDEAFSPGKETLNSAAESSIMSPTAPPLSPSETYLRDRGLLNPIAAVNVHATTPSPISSVADSPNGVAGSHGLPFPSQSSAAVDSPAGYRHSASLLPQPSAGMFVGMPLIMLQQACEVSEKFGTAGRDLREVETMLQALIIKLNVFIQSPYIGVLGEFAVLSQCRTPIEIVTVTVNIVNAIVATARYTQISEQLLRY